MVMQCVYKWQAGSRRIINSYDLRPPPDQPMWALTCCKMFFKMKNLKIIKNDNFFNLRTTNTTLALTFCKMPLQDRCENNLYVLHWAYPIKHPLLPPLTVRALLCQWNSNVFPSDNNEYTNKTVNFLSHIHNSQWTGHFSWTKPKLQNFMVL